MQIQIRFAAFDSLPPRRKILIAYHQVLFINLWLHLFISRVQSKYCEQCFMYVYNSKTTFHHKNQNHLVQDVTATSKLRKYMKIEYQNYERKTFTVWSKYHSLKRTLSNNRRRAWQTILFGINVKTKMNGTKARSTQHHIPNRYNYILLNLLSCHSFSYLHSNYQSTIFHAPWQKISVIRRPTYLRWGGADMMRDLYTSLWI